MPSTIGCLRKPAASPPRRARAACTLAVWAATCPFSAAPAAAYYSYPVGADPRSIAAGDLNRDGRPDLVTANGSSNSVSVLLNRGAGRFAALPDLSVVGAADAVIADLNGDADPDLVVAGSAVSVIPGHGDGTFGPRLHYADSTYFNCVAVGDVNGDGRPDVVAGVYVDEVAVFPGNGDGTLGPPAYFNANPRGAPAAVPRTAGAPGSGLPWRIMKVVMISGVAIGDLDGDGRPDIAVSLDDPYNEFMLQVLLGNGDGTFRQGASVYNAGSSRSITMADFNRDARPDLAAANSSDPAVTLILNSGGGAMSLPVRFPMRSYPSGVAAGDLNRDGAADLVSSNYPSEVCVRLGNGAGSLGAPAYFETGENPTSIAIADLDGDGRADLVTADETSNTVSVLFGDGAGGFGAPPTVAVPEASRSGVLALEGVQPNPVRAQATMRFSLPSAGRATLRVLDTAGRLVVTLEDGLLPAGEHVTVWDGRGPGGATAAPGVYVCELRFEGKTLSRMLTILR